MASRRSSTISVINTASAGFKTSHRAISSKVRQHDRHISWSYSNRHMPLHGVAISFEGSWDVWNIMYVAWPASGRSQGVGGGWGLRYDSNLDRPGPADQPRRSASRRWMSASISWAARGASPAACWLSSSNRPHDLPSCVRAATLALSLPASRASRFN